MKFIFGELTIASMIAAFTLSQVASAGTGTQLLELTEVDNSQQRVEDIINLTSWSDESVVGIAIRQGWQAVEPALNEYNWAYIDTALGLAEAHKKRLAISVIAGSFSPKWIYSLGAPKILLHHYHRPHMPEPWNQTYLHYWRKFVIQLANRYDGNPTVAYITATGPGRAEECYIATDPSDAYQVNQPAWVSAAKKIVHCYATQFKKTPFVLAWGKPVPGDNTDMQAVADYGRQFPLFGLKCDALSVAFPQFTDPEGMALLSANIVVMQAAHSGNVKPVISHGQTFGAAYLELYLP